MRPRRHGPEPHLGQARPHRQPHHLPHAFAPAATRLHGPPRAVLRLARPQPARGRIFLWLRPASGGQQQRHNRLQGAHPRRAARRGGALRQPGEGESRGGGGPQLWRLKGAARARRGAPARPHAALPDVQDRPGCLLQQVRLQGGQVQEFHGPRRGWPAAAGSGQLHAGDKPGRLLQDRAALFGGGPHAAGAVAVRGDRGAGGGGRGPAARRDGRQHRLRQKVTDATTDAPTTCPGAPPPAARPLVRSSPLPAAPGKRTGGHPAVTGTAGCCCGCGGAQCVAWTVAHRRERV
mmetsp:Transcript_15093/g.38823  ORF Transcript_15093/g.38823 Transcript_15093/m.38823 type:complete len:292 (-) Transcript_15093:79-954(-)